MKYAKLITALLFVTGALQAFLPNRLDAQVTKPIPATVVTARPGLPAFSATLWETTSFLSLQGHTKVMTREIQLTRSSTGATREEEHARTNGSTHDTTAATEAVNVINPASAQSFRLDPAHMQASVSLLLREATCLRYPRPRNYSQGT